ncbi:MAG: type II toxin-antitoxin system VapC family toxin [Thermoleophilaceae bacterium]
MDELLVDTDVFIDHLRAFRRIDPGEDRLAYSVVTRAELLSGREADRAGIDLLLAPFSEHPVDRATAERAGLVRRTTQLALPDALIAATALERGLELMTRNVGHFERVDGLSLRTPA